MADLTLSITFRGNQHTTHIRSLLDEFTRQTSIPVQLQVMDGTVARPEMTAFALYHKGPDVSEMYTTWMLDLIGMNALHPFSDEEITHIGPRAEFIQGAWDTCHLREDSQTWAIPWLVEPVLIHYRKDLLERAGVQENTAFRSLANLAQAASQLAHSGIDVPVELPYRWDHFGNFHALAGWVWGNGGDFCTPDGKRVLMDQPKVLGAMIEYFNLLRYLSPKGVQLTYHSPTCLFRQGMSAMTFTSLFQCFDWQNLPDEIRENWRAAIYPQTQYVGGENLVIWRHTPSLEQAKELVRYLTSLPVQSDLGIQAPQTNLQLPARLSVLFNPDLIQNPIFRIAAQSVSTGRSYLAVPLWGLIEDQLIKVIPTIESLILNDPSRQVEATVREVLLPLTKKLNLTLSKMDYFR